MEEQRIQSPWYQTILLIIVLFFWTAISGYVAEFSLSFIVTQPVIWISISILIFLSVSIQILLLVRWLKNSINIPDFEWTFKKVHVTFDEYKTMMKDYQKAYSFAMSRGIQVIPILLSIIIALFSIISPLILVSIAPYVLVSLPEIFGLEIMLFSLTFSVAVYRMMPSSAGDKFAMLDWKTLRNSMKILSMIDDISWYGIECKIGESQGYFIVKQSRPIGRVSGFESVIGVDGDIDSRGNIILIKGWIADSENQDSHMVETNLENPSPKMIEELIDKLIDQYLDSTELDEGSKRIVEDF